MSTSLDLRDFLDLGRELEYVEKSWFLSMFGSRMEKCHITFRVSFSQFLPPINIDKNSIFKLSFIASPIKKTF